MSVKMTPKEMEIVVDILQLGFACGLSHPFECFVNYIRSLTIGSYKEVREKEQKAYEAFAKFMHGCASAPNDPLLKITSENLNSYIEKYYNKDKKE